MGWEAVYHEAVLRECRVAAVLGFCYRLQRNEAAREVEEGAGLAELEAEAAACLCDVRKPEDRKAGLDGISILNRILAFFEACDDDWSGDLPHTIFWFHKAVLITVP